MRALAPLILAFTGFVVAVFFSAARAQMPGGAEIGFAEKFFTLYGPLGMGWLGFGWALWRNSKLQDQILAALTDNTKANTLLAERLAGPK